MQYTLEKATSLEEHLRMFADFYRRQRVLDDNTRQPVNPEKDITEPEFIRFWMGKLDYRQKTFKRIPIDCNLQLETILKIA